MRQPGAFWLGKTDIPMKKLLLIAALALLAPAAGRAQELRATWLTRTKYATRAAAEKHRRETERNTIADIMRGGKAKAA